MGGPVLGKKREHKAIRHDGRIFHGTGEKVRGPV